jgi:hypothetical protein
MKHSVLELQCRAIKAWCEKGWICIAFADGREIRFPVVKNRRLRLATPEQQSHVELICNGTGLHWPEVNEDLSVAGILEGRLGSE